MMTKRRATTIRKLRKLVRSPVRFFRDAHTNRLSAKSLRDLRAQDASTPKIRGHFRYSVVSAVYNAAPYLDEFFESMLAQSLDFGPHLELVLVNDGSTDETAAMLEKWRQRYPQNIKILEQSNSGQGAARNLGIPHATGNWVTFTDPDDFLDPNYFAELDAFLSRPGNEDVEFVATNVVFFHERTKQFDNSHPLNYRFAFGTRAVPIRSLALDVPGSSTVGLFRRSTLERLGTRFDSRVKPSFEDGHFTNAYLLGTADGQVGFCAAASYYYRKRVTGDSSIDKSWPVPERFKNVLEYGHLDLIRRAKAEHGKVPMYLQQVLLYDLCWYFKRIVGNIGSIGFLSEQQLSLFRRLVSQVMQDIEPPAIADFHLAGFTRRDYVGMLGLYHKVRPPETRLDVVGYDRHRRLLKLKYEFHLPTEVEVKVGDKVVEQLYAKTSSWDFAGETFVNERSFWVEAHNLDAQLTASSPHGEVHIFVKGHQRPSDMLLRQLASAWAPRPIKDSSCPAWAQELRMLSRTPSARAKYQGCWVLMDRDREAEDNAERFYRYLREAHPELKLFFVVSRDVPDWKRLEADGFNLIAYGSSEHRLALLLAKHYVSSHADAYVVNVVNPKWFGDIATYRFTFLQHGIIKDNLSRWLNGKSIDCFITSTQAEYDSIVADGSPYVFGKREVVLTGLARHDTLLAGAHRRERIVLVMPTWRQSLSKTASGVASLHGHNPDFFRSTYAVHWKRFLHSKRLKEITEDEGYKVIFCPHINLHRYLRGFNIPSYIKTISHDEGVSIQELFQRSALMVTDFSSVAFEMALLERPVLYYHFDFESALSGGHTSLHGYFDYARDGFGPICPTQSTLLDELESLLERDAVPSPKHAQRMKNTFRFRDGRNRERTYEAIVALERDSV
jgi:glycosyltransferase involved in cell wall biosynthesis/CDP-glycerol glycerophosphotransferase (TagB/SpsB family)